MSKKMIKVASVQKMKKCCNELLASEIPENAKRKICTMLESVLMEVNMYHGFNNNYWLHGGCDKWYAAGCPDTFPDKLQYIIGPNGYKAYEAKDLDFVGGFEGEYSRHYG